MCPLDESADKPTILSWFRDFLFDNELRTHVPPRSFPPSKVETPGTNVAIEYVLSAIGDSGDARWVPAGGVLFVFRGEWDNAEDYIAFDVVTHDGSTYRAKVDNSGVEPIAFGEPGYGATWELLAQKGDDGEPGMVWRGPWNVATAYEIGDVVSWSGASYTGQSYVAKTAHVGTTPTLLGNADWDVLTQHGEPGEDGDDGTDGRAIYANSGEPDATNPTDPPVIGDLYIDQDTGFLYERGSMAWTQIGELKGERGSVWHNVGDIDELVEGLGEYGDYALVIAGDNEGEIYIYNGFSDPWWNLAMTIDDGAAGSVFIVDVVDPTDYDANNDGDVWFNTVSNDLFQRGVSVTGVWNLVGNLAGTDGDDGANGADGQGLTYCIGVIDTNVNVTTPGMSGHPYSGRATLFTGQADPTENGPWMVNGNAPLTRDVPGWGTGALVPAGSIVVAQTEEQWYRGIETGTLDDIEVDTSLQQWEMMAEVAVTTAADIAIVDTFGHYAAANVETALAEAAADLALHEADTSGAHAGTAISVTETGIILPGTSDVQAALRNVEAYVQNLEESFEQHHHDERYFGHAAKISFAGNQAGIAENAQTKLTGSALQYSSISGFADTANNRLVIPVAGVYLLIGVVRYLADAVNVDIFASVIHVNGAQVALSSRSYLASAAAAAAPTAAVEVNLPAGAIVELCAYWYNDGTGGTKSTLGSAVSNYLSASWRRPYIL